MSIILPETGYLRLSQIIGDRKAVPPIPPNNTNQQKYLVGWS